MVRELDPNQLKKIDRRYIQPIYFCHLYLKSIYNEDLTLYLSDRNFAYNGHKYEAYISDLSNIENQVRNFGSRSNINFTLQFKNEKYIDLGNTNLLIDFFGYAPTEKRFIEIYKLLIDPNEEFLTDVSTKIFKGEMGQPYEIYDPPTSFKIDVNSMLFGKNVALPLGTIVGDTPSDNGKYRNIIYGSVKKVICPITIGGWISTIAMDLEKTTTEIVVSDVAHVQTVLPFSIIIDNEQMLVTDRTGFTLTVTRGDAGTEVQVHNKGATLHEVRDDLEAEVAQHPVKSIGDVWAYRDNQWVRIIEDVTKEINASGRARLLFTKRVKYEEKVDQEGSSENTINEGTHEHTIDETVFKTVIPATINGGTNPLNVVDKNEATYCTITDVQTLIAGYPYETCSTLVKQHVYILLNDTGTGEIRLGSTVLSAGLAAPGVKTWIHLEKTGGSWGDDLEIDGLSGGAHIYELHKDNEYTHHVVVNEGPASGIGVTTVTHLTGNRVANMFIPDAIAADVEGYEDGGNLIERPDLVRKHILTELLGFSAGDIGDSFTQAGTDYETLGGMAGTNSHFAFVLHEVATNAIDLFDKMDLCSRSNCFESGGKFQLVVELAVAPIPAMTFDKNNVKGSFIFGKTEASDLRTAIRGHYFRDYNRSGPSGEMYQGVVLAGFPEYMIGSMIEDFDFPCLGDNENLAIQIALWIFQDRGIIKKTVKFQAFWDAMILENLDSFVITSAIAAFNGLAWKTIKLIENPKDQTIEIEGLEYAWASGPT